MFKGQRTAAKGFCGKNGRGRNLPDNNTGFGQERCALLAKQYKKTGHKARKYDVS